MSSALAASRGTEGQVCSGLLQRQALATRSLAWFFGGAYAPAYLLWGLVALDAAGLVRLPVSGTLLLFIGGLGPALAAVGLTAAESGGPGVGALLKQAVRWRVRPGWYAAALGLPALVVLGGLGFGLALGESLPPPPPVFTWLTLPGMFVLLLLLGAIEELGWRGYALPRLQARFTPVRASLVLALLWGFWHAPQWFIPSTGQASFPFPAFLLWVAALSVLYTWMYSGTGGSVLLVLFTHAATNAYPLPWMAALQALPAQGRGVDPHLLVMVAQVGLAVAVLACTRGRLSLAEAR
jgi:membrane protease YdiL (CAAX protease family)